MVEWIACPFRVSHSAGALAVAVSFVFLLLIATTRRLPLAVGLLCPMIGFSLDLWLAIPSEFPAVIAALAGAMTALLGVGLPLLLWILFRVLYSIPGRLSHKPGAGDELRGAADFLLMTADLGKLGFWNVGRLYIADGPERQTRTYFADTAGTTLARRTVHSFGVRGLSFISEQDGARVITSNWPRIQPWPLPAGTIIHYHHYCREPEALLRLHRRHLAEHAVDAPAARPESDILPHECRTFEEAIEEAVRIGSLFRDGRGRLRMTLKGMYGCIGRALFQDFRRRHLQVGR